MRHRAHRPEPIVIPLWRWFSEAFRRRRLDRESAEELALHVQLLVEEKRHAGLSVTEALRAARLELGMY